MRWSSCTCMFALGTHHRAAHGQAAARVHHQAGVLLQQCVVKAIVIGGEHQAVEASDVFGGEWLAVQVEVVIAFAWKAG